METVQPETIACSKMLLLRIINLSLFLYFVIFFSLLLLRLPCLFGNRTPETTLFERGFTFSPAIVLSAPVNARKPLENGGHAWISLDRSCSRRGLLETRHFESAIPDTISGIRTPLLSQPALCSLGISRKYKVAKRIGNQIFLCCLYVSLSVIFLYPV